MRERYFVRERSDAATCLAVVESTAAPGACILYTDEWNGYGRVSGLGIGHGTVRHSRDEAGRREWARDGDGIREVHCNTCEGAGAGLRTFLRVFRRVHKFSLAEYVACLTEIGASASMSKAGSPYDNAKAESFFKTLKKEEVYLRHYQNFEEARTNLGAFLEAVYNVKRLHSSLGYLPPAEFEEQFTENHALTSKS